MKIQDTSFNGLKVTVGTKSVTHAPTHPLTDAPKAICPINFFKVGGIKRLLAVYRKIFGTRLYGGDALASSCILRHMNSCRIFYDIQSITY